MSAARSSAPAKMLHDLNVDFDVTPSVLEHRIHMIEEQAELARTALQYQYVVQSLNNDITRLSTVIKG